VVEEYKKDVDQSLLRRNLGLSVEERFLQLSELQKFAAELREAGQIGGGGFDALASDTVELDLFGLRCLCLNLRKLVEVKRAAGRPKDLEALAELESLLEQSGE
jgi:hypothetical protein